MLSLVVELAFRSLSWHAPHGLTKVAFLVLLGKHAKVAIEALSTNFARKLHESVELELMVLHFIVTLGALYPDVTAGRIHIHLAVNHVFAHRGPLQ